MIKEFCLNILFVKNGALLALFLISLIITFLLLWNNKFMNGEKKKLFNSAIKGTITRFVIYYILIFYTMLDFPILKSFQDGITTSILICEISYQIQKSNVLLADNKLKQLTERLLLIFKGE